MNKKILINGLSIGKQNTGVQYYSKYLHINLKNNCEVELLTLNYSFLKNSFARIFYENFFLNSFFNKKNYSIYHATNYVIPFFFKKKCILTVHDLITIDYPKLCKNTSVIYFKLLFKSSLKKAEKIITVSETVKRDIIKHFNVNESKIRVISLGINPIFKRTLNVSVFNKYNLPKKYILFVGNIEAKKNLKNLVIAFAKLKKNNSCTHKLVFVGKKGWKVSGLMKLIKRLGLENDVFF